MSGYFPSSTWREGGTKPLQGLCPEKVRRGSPWKALTGQIVLGESGFLERVKAFLKGNEGTREIPKAQRYAVKPPFMSSLEWRKVPIED